MEEKALRMRIVVITSAVMLDALKTKSFSISRIPYEATSFLSRFDFRNKNDKKMMMLSKTVYMLLPDLSKAYVMSYMVCQTQHLR